MRKRKLRIVKRIPPPVIAICEFCNTQFASSEPRVESAMVKIASEFESHKCKSMDSSQHASRIVRGARDGE
jgi:hypothetical protein